MGKITIEYMQTIINILEKYTLPNEKNTPIEQVAIKILEAIKGEDTSIHESLKLDD